VFTLLATTQINALLELEATIQRFKTFVRPTLRYTNPLMLYEKTVHLIVQIQAYITSMNRDIWEWVENIIFLFTKSLNMSINRDGQTPDISRS
jgi:hypothetical protein